MQSKEIEDECTIKSKVNTVSEQIKRNYTW